MALIIFFILGMVIHLAHSREMQGVATALNQCCDDAFSSCDFEHGIVFACNQLDENESDSEPRELVLNQTVTAVLGEEIYLHCLYTGKSDISFSSWNRLDSSMKSRKMAGYNIKGPFKRENFDIPASITNLTVKINVTSVDLQGKYMCVFNSDEDETKDTMYLRVVVRPDIDTNAWDEVVNGTLYQVTTCSASSAKPEAVIRWEISGTLPRDDVFSVNTTNIIHRNGTGSSTSVLRFPLILNNESTVTCVVEHPAFTEPKKVNIEVNTFVSPFLSMETVLIQEGGEDYQEVICSAIGGKPHPNITWTLPKLKNTAPSKRKDSKPNSVITSFRFPSDLYEGENVSCVFDYMFLPFKSTRTITLPIYYLSLIQLKDLNYVSNSENQTLLAFEEGDTDITVRMDVSANVPSYKINCSRENQPLPEDVDVVGNDLFIRGPVAEHHVGRYLCQASYRRHLVSLEFTVEVHPKVLLPVTFPPNISVNLEENSDYIRIECLASNAIPAANVSWILPQRMNITAESDITNCNGSFSVKSTLTVPTCMSREYVIECVVNHPSLMEKEGRHVALPVCAPPNITLQSRIEWNDEVAHIRLVCSVQSQSPVLISWAVQCQDNEVDPSELLMSQTEFQSVAHIPIHSHAGCTATCAVQQQGLEKPENKSIILPSLKPPVSRVFIYEEEYTHICHAVCEFRGDGVKTNISWILPDENAAVHATTESKYDEIKVEVNLTYEFQASDYEGKDLICVIQNKLGLNERRVIHVPQYYISSVEVLNKTTQDRKSYGQREHRLALQENVSNQKIHLKAHGNATSYETTCYREDGSFAHTMGMTLVFTHPVSEKDAGLYICQVSYLHHTAKVFIRVDVTSEETQHMIFITVCFSSAAAITLILIIFLIVLCKCGKSHPTPKDRRQRESLAALMQDPRCSERTVLPGQPGPHYAELVHYSIVFDAKSTV